MIPIPPLESTRESSARLMGEAHWEFLQRHKGKHINPTDLFCVTDKDILCNNLHYETALGGYMPSGSAVTEAQALAVLGMTEMYRGTGEQKWLDRAELYARRYIEVFYMGKEPSQQESIWRSHWVVNGKDPFTCYGPIDYSELSSSGNLSYELAFSNGFGTIKSGAPEFGEKLIRVYKAYTGELEWENIFAAPKGGSTYAIEWFVTGDRKRMIPDGRELDDGEPYLGHPPGTIKLVEPLSGLFKVDFATLTGPTIDRHMPFEAWPMWHPIGTTEFGNAVDAELWACEMFWELYDLTQKEYWLRCYRSCLFTLKDFADMGQQTDYFLRDTRQGISPHTEGISYDYSVTDNAEVTISRGRDGYIWIQKDRELFAEDVSQVGLDQIAIVNNVTTQTAMNIEIGCSSPNVTWQLDFDLHENIKSPARGYTILLDERDIYSPAAGGSVSPKQVTIPFYKLMPKLRSNLQEQAYLNGSTAIGYNKAIVKSVQASSVLGNPNINGRSARVELDSSEKGAVIGFWGLDSGEASVDGAVMTYRTGVSAQLVLKITHANGFKYFRSIPQTNGQWSTLSLSWSQFAPYVSGTDPVGPVNPPSSSKIGQIEISTSDSFPDKTDPTIGGQWFEVFSWGDTPSNYAGSPSLFWKFKTVFKSHFDFLIKIGDVRISNASAPALPYTPGVVPFTTNYSRDTKKKDFWRGVPLQGYQYPSVWGQAAMLDYSNNVVDFWYDGQVRYHAETGLWGPIYPCFVWERQDNFDRYGDSVNDWVYDLFGSEPWPGYHSRAYFAACRLYYVLWKEGHPIPEKLTQVVDRYTTYLGEFMTANYDKQPFNYPKPPLLPFKESIYSAGDDENAHMTGSYMAGAILLKIAELNNPQLERVIEGSLLEFERTFVVANDADDYHMNGAWSSFVGGNYYYGFHAGEIWRALGLYLQYCQRFKREPDTGTVVPFIPDSFLTEDGFDLLQEDGSLLNLGLVASFTNNSQIITEGGADSLALEDGTTTLVLE